MTRKKKTYSFQPRLPDGTRLHLRFATKAAKDAYIDKFKEKLQSVRLGFQENFNAPTIAEYSAIWLSERRAWIAENRITLPAWEVNERHFRLYINPAIGEIPMDQLTPNMTESFLSGLRDKNLGPASRNRVRGTLQAFYNRALKKRVVSANPIHGVEKEDEESARPAKILIHDLKDADTWLSKAYEIGPMWGCIETLILNAGPRKSQIIPLRWKDYEPELRRLWMGRMWEQASREIKNRTKGRKAHESFHVGVNDVLAAALERWRLESPWTEPEDFIFSLKRGVHLDPQSIETRHNKLRAMTGIDMTIHEGRHTYGSQFIAQGGSLEAAQEQLGHKSRKTTEDFYRHAIRKDLRDRANVVNLGAGTSQAPNTQAQSQSDDGSPQRENGDSPL